MSTNQGPKTIEKLIIMNGDEEYEINEAQDLYNMYNDWVIDYNLDPISMTDEEYETVAAIRDEYYSVFKAIEKKTYELLEFEARALEIIGGSDEEDE